MFSTLLNFSRSETETARVDIHALCWNEERMLPYFFRHYDPIANRYFIYDNGSNDRSLEILKAHPKVILRSFEAKGNSFVLAAQAHYNECWKESRGACEWVIVCNVDEHFYHPNLKRYLGDCHRRGVTIIYPEGYEMVAETFPESDRPLYKTVRKGMREPFFDKPQLFNPNEITEINFAPGRHTAAPSGTLREPPKKELKLLHFKYLGVKYVSSRQSSLGSRLKSADLKHGYGKQYAWSEQRNDAQFEALNYEAVKVLSPYDPVIFCRRIARRVRRSLT